MLTVVTGKGGAGKSLLSLALAHRASVQGKRVWLVELGRKRDRDFARLPGLLGKKQLEHTPTEVTLPGTRQKIEACVLDPTQSLAEYVDLKLPTAGLAGVLLNNRVTASFLEVVPGLPDLVQLGKLWHSLTQRKNPPDEIVLDAPATGHALALLKAPENFRRITRMGPVYRDATILHEFLTDPAQTRLVLAALPEEMAVQETKELQKHLGKEFPKALVYVNKCFPELPPLAAGAPDNIPTHAYRYARGRYLREQQAALELKGAHLLPFIFPEPGRPPAYLQLSELLA